MKFLRAFFLSLVVIAGLCASAVRSAAQVPPQKLNTTEDIAADGKATLTVEMAFDASGWKQWKALVGEEPARLRAMMKYQFAAYVIDDFKFEKDDMNRTAKVTMTSASGPELRRDGSFRIPVEKEFSKVSGGGREWFFSGTNAAAGGTLMTLKVVLPPNATGVNLLGAGGNDQGLAYSLNVAGGKSGLFKMLGAIIAGIGVLGLIGGFVLGKGAKTSAAAPA